MSYEQFKIIVFTTKCCVNCKSTKEFLKKACEDKDIELEVIDVSEATPDNEDYIKLYSLTQVPTAIGINCLTGEELERRQGALTPFSIDEFILCLARRFPVPVKGE